MPCPYCERNGTETAFSCTPLSGLWFGEGVFCGHKRAKEVLRHGKRTKGGGQRRGVPRVCASCKSAATHGKMKQKMQSERRATWACAL